MKSNILWYWLVFKFDSEFSPLQPTKLAPHISSSLFLLNCQQFFFAGMFDLIRQIWLPLIRLWGCPLISRAFSWFVFSKFQFRKVFMASRLRVIWMWHLICSLWATIMRYLVFRLSSVSSITKGQTEETILVAKVWYKL